MIYIIVALILLGLLYTAIALGAWLDPIDEHDGEEIDHE
jgi:hypothetical protein